MRRGRDARVGAQHAAPLQFSFPSPKRAGRLLATARQRPYSPRPPHRRYAMRPRHTLSILLAAALGSQPAPPPKAPSAEAKQAIDPPDAKGPRPTRPGPADPPAA